MNSNVCIVFSESYLFDVDNSQLDDEASSTASFEDVGIKSEDLSGHKELVIRDPRFKTKGKALGDKVPVVTYVLQYRGLTGHVIECECMPQPALER